MKILFEHAASTAALLAALAPLPVLAAETTPVELPVVVVTGRSTPADVALSADDIARVGVTTPDSARLLAGQPGVSLKTGGAISSLPVLNGLADDRVRVLVDGMSLTAACPNHMNPPLSYVAPGRIQSIEAIAGVTPVSLGGDSIGGTIVVEPAEPAFAAKPGEEVVTGRVSTSYRSNGDGITVSGDTTVATDRLSVGYAGSWSRTLDYEGGGPNRTVRATESENYDHNLTLGIRAAEALVTLRAGLHFTPYEAFPNQRMDLTDNESQYANARLQRDFDWGAVDLRVYWQHVEHEMDMLEDKGGAMPMNTRTTDLGYSLAIEVPVTDGSLKFGSELHSLTLDDWWPPLAGSMMMGPNTFWNINNGTRKRIGHFVEWDSRWSEAWSAQFGLRNDIVLMDTGNVQPYSTMGMMHAADIAAAAAFNARDHERTDVNLDATAMIRFEPGPGAAYSLGLARKTRSPSLYERYTWGRGNMALAMVNWFGDANGYVGDIDLDPEVAYTAGLTADWHAPDGAWRVKVTPYVTYVEDFIDADPFGTFGPGNEFVQLKFANHDALLYGFDVAGSAALAKGSAIGDLDLTASLGLVRGERINTGDDLYHLPPLRLRLVLDHRLGDWSNGIEMVASASKTLVNMARNEPKTPGYALLNLRTAYEWPGLRLDAGIDNVLDQRWYDPLGGVDYADFDINGGPLRPLEGEGRSFNIGMTVSF